MTEPMSAHERLNAMNGEWWDHEWSGIYAGMLLDWGYSPYAESGQPQYRMFFMPPGGWRVEKITASEATDD